ncbi:M3 family oligoendopeptidase [Fusibacter sp. JL298sf-3]
MTFNEYPYVRLDVEKLQADFTRLISAFKSAESFEEQDRLMAEINDLRNETESMFTLASVRNSIDTTDDFYDNEKTFWDEVEPVYQGLISTYYEALVASRFKKELEDKWGKQIFTIAELSLKVFKPEIIELLQKENKLVSEYVKLTASAKILFEGEERNLSQMTPFSQSKDRNTRIMALKAVTAFFESNEDAFDRIYDDMVKVRHEIALKLGFKNYIELGYARLTRSDYDANMVANYRKQVYEDLVPLANSLRARQAKRLGLDSLKYYDEQLEFNTGNATPKGDPQWILENGKKMYREMSPETDAFFTYMTDHQLLDLVAKKGKAGGGYCTFVSKYKSPFIFSNFNGTSGDVDVLTHEAGHAFQVFSSRDYKLPEYVWPTYEACEIHSMSMEFFAWPWMENFFKEDVEKYKFSHLAGALLFIPYGVTVDEFQHFVYEHPEATPAERKAKWSEIEKKYLPHRDYDDNDFMNRGGFWFKQGHIFSTPFYYIDYTLAQVCAFEFWNKSRVNREAAWNDYLTLCKAGGSQSFLGLIETANLHNPFVDGTIRNIVEPIKAYLDSVDDLKL